MEITKMKLADLNPAPYNPRKDLTPADKEYQHIKRSIEDFGYIDPIIVNVQNNVIVGGHQRFKVLAELGYEEADCVLVDFDETTEKACNAALNKAQGDWDEELLNELLKELDAIDIDMEAYGFDMSFLEEESTGEAREDDYDPEEELAKPAKAKPGDIYKLGEHRLMCGDATCVTDIDKLMDGKKADMVFTDPPYGMKKEADGVANDNQNFDGLLDFNRQWIPLTFGALKENGSWYCWGIDEPLMDIYSNILKPMAKQNLITFRNLLTWDKGNGQGQCEEMRRMYSPADEKCLFVMCGVQGFNNNSDNYFDEYEPIRKYLEEQAKKANIDASKLKEICGVGMYSHWFTKSQWDLMLKEHYVKLQQYCVENDLDAFHVQYDEIKKQYDEIKKQWYASRAYFNNTHDNMNNVWHFDRAGNEERVGHATPKPLALCSRAIKSSSRESELVLDVFGGSGSTMMACEQLDRRCYMMELEPKWVDVIIDRWEKLTGNKAQLVTTE